MKHLTAPLLFTGLAVAGGPALAADAAPATAVAAAPAAAALAPAAAPAQVGTREKAQAAQAALDDFLRAWERGDVASLQGRLDPSMIGYGQFFDAVQGDAARFRQLRFTLQDVQVMAGPDVAVVQAHWQKRFLVATTFQPALQEGNAMFLMHAGTGGWRLAAVAGDTPFAGGGGVLGQLVLQPAVLSCAAVAATCAVTLEVLDPDLSGSGSVVVQLASSSGDREALTLIETMPGRFQLLPASLVVANAAPAANNGTVEAAPGATITVTYTDSNAGSGRPATPVSARVRLP